MQISGNIRPIFVAGINVMLISHRTQELSKYNLTMWEKPQGSVFKMFALKKHLFAVFSSVYQIHKLPSKMVKITFPRSKDKN